MPRLWLIMMFGAIGLMALARTPSAIDSAGTDVQLPGVGLLPEVPPRAAPSGSWTSGEALVYRRVADS
jgi:hypothetical protein